MIKINKGIVDLSIIMSMCLSQLRNILIDCLRVFILCGCVCNFFYRYIHVLYIESNVVTYFEILFRFSHSLSRHEPKLYNLTIGIHIWYVVQTIGLENFTGLWIVIFLPFKQIQLVLLDICLNLHIKSTVLSDKAWNNICV